MVMEYVIKICLNATSYSVALKLFKKIDLKCGQSLHFLIQNNDKKYLQLI